MTPEMTAEEIAAKKLHDETVAAEAATPEAAEEANSVEEIPAAEEPAA